MLRIGFSERAPGDDPDLEEVRRFRADGLNSLCTTPVPARMLNLSRADHRAVAQAVAVLERTVEHIREDLHVAVRMCAKASARLHPVVIDHAQRAVTPCSMGRSSRQTRAVATVELMPSSSALVRLPA